MSMGTVFFIGVVTAVLFFGLRDDYLDWKACQRIERLTERERDREDAEVAWLDSLWALPTRVPGTDRRI